MCTRARASVREFLGPSLSSVYLFVLSVPSVCLLLAITLCSVVVHSLRPSPTVGATARTGSRSGPARLVSGQCGTTRIAPVLVVSAPVVAEEYVEECK